ncbi:uncharacterized protein FRV6_00689 [Fusarium oxysporum]|uniref:Uncharacterized protein n=1 Tax=Fusarium oxysporum TaxID=5507 RepID=A0A2H3SJ04_FUSOX|nr:uncharacterized protein FRV6_00689 [Fusarium oxysporum]
MKLIYTALFALAATAVNACDSTLCEGATVLRVVPFPYTYICGKDKTKCDEIW